MEQQTATTESRQGSKPTEAEGRKNIEHRREQLAKIRPVVMEAARLATRLMAREDVGQSTYDTLSKNGSEAMMSEMIELGVQVNAEDTQPLFGRIFVAYADRKSAGWFYLLPKSERPDAPEVLRVGVHEYTQPADGGELRYKATQQWDGNDSGSLAHAQLTLGVLEAVAAHLDT